MMKRIAGLLLAATAGLFVCSMAWSQAIFSTITGTIADPSNAVIPGAQVTLTNATSGTVRQTTANAQGYYTFASVPVGTYNLAVSSMGFQKFEVRGISLGGGELRTINATLKIGTASQTVQVNSAGDMLTPVSTGEQTDTLRTVQLQNYVQTGSNAAEFLRIMPGFAINHGVSNSAAYTGAVIGINAAGNGGNQSPLGGSFSYDGMPGNTLDIVSDGAHVADPACNCATPVNPNSDFLQEFKVLTSDFSASDQKGPMVVTSVTKAGGTQFHGNAFFQARNYELNSNDAYNKAIGLTRPPFAFYYSGGSIGGPVLIPHTDFNHARNKLFFFVGFEYFYQKLNTGALTATVPTTSIINGDFSQASLSQLGTTTASGGPPGKINAGTQAAWGGTQMPAGVIDPNMQVLMKLYPAPNADPASTNGFNYTNQIAFNQNNTQLTARVDYDISNNTKIWSRWNWQTEVQPFPLQLWGSSIDQVPYPSEVLGRNRSNSIAATLTHVFSPTLTNETVFSYTQVLFPNIFTNPDAVNPSKIGYNNPALFPHNTKQTGPVDQIPNFGGPVGTPSEVALIDNKGGFYVGGPGQGAFANKYMPSASDTLTKVWRTHTFAAGLFYEWIQNAEPNSAPSNGTMTFYPADNPNFTYGDAYADELAGNLTSYNEYNMDALGKISWWTFEGFAQDSWAVTPKVTLNYGIRLTHFAPWIDDNGFGYAVFDPAKYTNANNGSCAKAPNYCGFEWHARNSAVPLGGFPTRALYYQPRIGVAYDLHGNGNTVIRGGWGYFWFHRNQYISSVVFSAGEEGITINPANINNNRLLARQLNNTTYTAVPSAPSPVSSTDDTEPYSMEYNFTIEQRTPWSGLFSAAYIGNVTRDLPTNGGYGSNINLVPLGAMLSASNPGLANPNNYRPMVGYGDLNVVLDNLYANYNSLQMKWSHQGRGSLIQVNYTYAKALGIANPGGSNLQSLAATLNPFDMHANYGPLPTDRRQIFNAVYSINLPNPIHGGSAVLSGLANGWQLSGSTSLQSGANLTGNAGNYNFNTNTSGAIIPGSISVNNPKGIPINPQSIYGTPDMGNGHIIPSVTCDPKSNLSAHQFVNASCFALPTTTSQTGPSLLPAIYGPAYFNSDLGIFKNFRIGSREDSRLQIRAQASNFLNHPLYSYPNSNDLTLRFKQNSTTGAITQTNSNFGTTLYKQGSRIVEFQAKYYF